MAAFSSDRELVEKCLGFEPQDFLGEVTKMVDEQLESGIEAYKRDLLSIAATKGYKNVTDSVIDEACLKLKEKMKSIYDKNMDKFELYAKRNIFSIPADANNSSSSSSNSSNAGDNSTDTDLMSARERYMELQSACQRAQGNCDDGDALLKDMRSALFNLRVNSQVIEEYEIQPLSKSVSEMTGKNKDLEALTVQADALVREMEKVTGPLQGDGKDDDVGKDGGGVSNKGTGIRIGNAAETLSLASAMR
jgi:hypothetical protein